MRRFALALLTILAAPAAALAQDEVAPPPAASGGQTGQGMGAGQTGGMMQKMQARFNAANTTHDGHLTAAQAQAAGFDIVSRNFAQIDTAHRGYITFNDIIAWHLDQEAQRMEQKAASLRAQD